MKNNTPPFMRTILDKCPGCGKSGIKKFKHPEYNIDMWSCKFCKFVRYDPKFELGVMFTNANGDIL